MMKYFFGLLLMGVVQMGAAQYVNHGFDVRLIAKSDVVGLFSKADSVYGPGEKKAKENWGLSTTLSLMKNADLSKLDVTKGKVFVVPVEEKMGKGKANYKLVMCQAKEGFTATAVAGTTGFFNEPTNAEVICSLYVNKERLHSSHFPFLIGALSSMVKHAADYESDAQRDLVLKRGYYYEGLQHVVFEVADLDTVIKTEKNHLQRGMPYGLFATDSLWKAEQVTIPGKRGVAYIVEQHRKDKESLIHRYFYVPQKGMIYLETVTVTDHPSARFTVKDIFRYGTPMSDGANK